MVIIGMSAIARLCLFGYAEMTGFNNVNQLGDGDVAVKPPACRHLP